MDFETAKLMDSKRCNRPTVGQYLHGSIFRTVGAKAGLQIQRANTRFKR